MRYISILCVFGLLWTYTLCSTSLQDRKNAIQVPNGSKIINSPTGFIVTPPSNISLTYERRLDAQDKREVDGWVAATGSNAPNFTYSYVAYTVPPSPTLSEGQILYFFNAFENAAGTQILQPVVAFEGGAWSIASWYGNGPDYFNTDLVPIIPGDFIEGVISYEPASGVWAILGSVNGVLTTAIYPEAPSQVDVVMTSFAVTLEVYGVTACEAYPPSNYIGYENIVLKDSGVVIENPIWGPVIFTESCDANTNCYSNNYCYISWDSTASS